MIGGGWVATIRSELARRLGGRFAQRRQRRRGQGHGLGAGQRSARGRRWQRSGGFRRLLAAAVRELQLLADLDLVGLEAVGFAELGNRGAVALGDLAEVVAGLDGVGAAFGNGVPDLVPPAVLAAFGAAAGMLIF